jgi:predicted membrane-bound spermidine synthase
MRALFACFFVSGATALIYEVVWLRMLGLVFGHTVYALTTVLAAFMAGLGLATRTVMLGAPKSNWARAKRCRELYGTSTPCARRRR